MKLNTYTKQLYLTLKIIIVVLYFVSIFKVWKKAPKYLKYVDLIFSFIVGILLIVIYNPLNTKPITNFNKKIAFSAGIAILVNSYIMQYLTKTILNNDILSS